MSYNADWGKTPAFKAHVEANGDGEGFTNSDGYPKEPVNSILWALLSIGVSSITEKNISEVYARLKFIEHAFQGGVWGQRYIGTDGDYSLARNYEKYTLTPEHVQQVLHLSTNNSTRSRSEWVKSVVGIIQRDAYYDRAKELFFGKSLTPTKCINVAVDAFKLEYEAHASVNA